MDPPTSRRRFLILTSGLATAMLLQSLGCRRRSSSPSTKTSSSNPKIELFNLALQHEYGSVVQYTNHVAILSDNKGKYHLNDQALSTFHRIIFEEIKHAIQVSILVRQLGGIPSIAVWPPQSANELSKLLHLDLAAEKSAIELYERLLALQLNPKHQGIIGRIQNKEATHRQFFATLIHSNSTKLS